MSLLSGCAQALATSDEKERTERLSHAVAEVVPHRALATLVDACALSPVSRVGEPEIADRITTGDITRLGSSIPVSQAWQGEADVAGERRPVVAITAPGDLGSVLLVVRDDDAPLDAEQLTILQDTWSLFAVATQRTLAGAAPGDLNASRAAAGERARVAAELADAHGTALAGVLGTLRARHLDDRAARQAAIDLASSALVELRASVERERELGDEQVGEAFERLRPELTPLARISSARLELESVPGWGTQLLARLPLDDRTGVEANADDPLAALHPRELEVLAELTRGRRNRDIAETLSISENTVKFHVANVFAKLGVNSRSQAALIARDAGIGRTTLPTG